MHLSTRPFSHAAFNLSYVPAVPFKLPHSCDKEVAAYAWRNGRKSLTSVYTGTTMKP
jgi:hypothetical protein